MKINIFEYQCLDYAALLTNLEMRGSPYFVCCKKFWFILICYNPFTSLVLYRSLLMLAGLLGRGASFLQRVISRGSRLENHVIDSEKDSFSRKCEYCICFPVSRNIWLGITPLFFLHDTFRKTCVINASREMSLHVSKYHRRAQLWQ